MKKIIMALIFFVTFSLIISGNKVYKLEDVYNNIDKNLCDVEESGLRLEFLTSKSLISQLNDINKIVDLNTDIVDEKINNNQSYIFQGLKENYKVKIIANKEQSMLRTIIEIINTSGLMDINKIKNVLEKLEDDTIQDKQYFSYLKGKINNDNEENIENLKGVIGEEYIKNMNKISIDSGITGIINLKNNEKINYSIMNYATSTYLIVGSPIIFTTY